MTERSPVYWVKSCDKMFSRVLSHRCIYFVILSSLFIVVSILWYYNIIILWPISSVTTLAFLVVPTYIRSWYTHVVLYCQTFRPGSWLFSTKLLTFWSHCHNLAVGIPSVYENWFFLFWRGRSIQGGRRFLHARALTPVDLSSFPRFTNLLPEKWDSLLFGTLFTPTNSN